MLYAAVVGLPERAGQLGKKRGIDVLFPVSRGVSCAVVGPLQSEAGQRSQCFLELCFVIGLPSGLCGVFRAAVHVKATAVCNQVELLEGQSTKTKAALQQNIDFSTGCAKTLLNGTVGS